MTFKPNKNRLVVTLTTTLLGILSYWLYTLDVFNIMLEFDRTYLSFAMMGLFVVVWSNFVRHVFMYDGYGWAVDNTDRRQYIDTTETTWFMSNIFAAIGMAGTVFGLMLIAIALKESDLDPNNIADFKVTITATLTGMGTAFLTTIVGQCASIFLKMHVWFLGIRHESV